MIPNLVEGSWFRHKKIRGRQIESSNGNINSKTSRLGYINASTNWAKIRTSLINTFGNRDAG